MTEDRPLREVLKQRRKDKHLTLKQVTQLSGVSAAYMARCERGERFPSAAILKKLARPLEFSETELLKRAGFLSQDDNDQRFENLKRDLKRAIAHTLVTIYRTIDNA